jgi:hypothetical protein
MVVVNITVIMATPSVVLILTTVNMVVNLFTNAGPTALLPTGTNDQAIMYASRCPKLSG